MLKTPSLVLVFLLLCNLAHAQESLVLKALESQQELQSLLALPDVGDAALEPFPDENGDTFYDGLTAKQESLIVDHAYPLMSAKWPFNKIFVCWESDDAAYKDQRALVQSAISETWQAASDLEFIGWKLCENNSRGIRIAVSDEGPHAKRLGKYLRPVKNGVVLNFTYQLWGQSCQDRMDFCNKAIAVHEFGHAIGFAHEQNRPDTPGECTKAPQGSNGDILLTPWDPHSVMNYCNELYSNNGNLSKFDIAAVRYIYGEPK